VIDIDGGVLKRLQLPHFWGAGKCASGEAS
jgi:hypothetical protein